MAVLVQLLRAVRFRREGTERIGPGRTVMHFIRCAWHLEYLRDWLASSPGSALQAMLERRPSLVTRVVHPYLNSDWPAARKLEVVAAHYALLLDRLAFLRPPIPSALTLAALGEDLRLRLGETEQFEHEGELAMHLTMGTQRLYSIAFTLGQVDDVCLAYIGALQGLHSPEALDIYRELTHRLHGLRPRDLLLNAFRSLCVQIGVERILAISDAKPVSSSPYFETHDQVLASYDRAWLDAGGRRGDGGFFELAPHRLPRTNDEMPTRKRAQYRRRYALLDDMSAQMARAVAAA